MKSIYENSNTLTDEILKFRHVSDENEYKTSEKSRVNIYRNASLDEYLSFVEKLVNFGFTLVQQNENYGNFFSSLVKDSAVSVYFTPCDKTVRVAIDDEAFTSCLEEKPCSLSGKTEIYFFENDQTLIDCGMCILIQCPDSSFFVIDSGHYYQINDNDRLHKFMRERTPEGEKIVISGWLITHSHTDHVSKMLDFVKYNCDDVVIKAFYMNLISDDYEMEAWDSEERAFNAHIKNMLSEKHEIPCHRLHSGESVFIGNLKLDVMYTHEDVYPEKICDFNDTSCVVMLETENTRIFIPGDASYMADKVLISRFGDSLKADIVQISHHGHFGLSCEAYKKISADCAVFPITRIKFNEEYPRQEANRLAIELAREYYITSDGTVKITLPYEEGSVSCLDDETFEDFEKIKRLWGYEYSDEYKKELFELFQRNGGKLEKTLLPIKYDGTFQM